MADFKFENSITIPKHSGAIERKIVVAFWNGKTAEPLWINKDGGVSAEVKFQTSRAYGSLGKASIELYNPSDKIVEDFTTLTYANKSKQIAVYAGRASADVEAPKLDLIYLGDILFATLTQGRPDSIFKIEAMEKFATWNTVQNFTTSRPNHEGKSWGEESTLTDLIKEIIEYEFVPSKDDSNKGEYKATGLTANFDALNELKKQSAERYTKYNIPKEQMTFNGTIGEFLGNKLKDFNGMQFTIDGNTVYLLPNSQDQSFMTSFVDKDQMEKEGNRIITSDPDNKYGVMIGFPSISYFGVNLRILYNRDVKAGDYFLLKSRATGLKQYNIVYQIAKVNYNMQLRGRNFYMDIEAYRFIPPKNSDTPIDNTIDASTNKNNAETTSNNINEKITYITKEALRQLEIRMPCEVIDVKENNYVAVQPTVKRITTQIGESGEKVQEPYPSLTVPIKRNASYLSDASGGIGMFFPIKKGDCGWVVGASVNTDSLRQAKDTANATVDSPTREANLYTFGYFEPDLTAKRGGMPFTIAAEDENSLSIQTVDGKTKIVLDPSGEIRIVAVEEVKINAPTTTITGNVDVSGTLTAKSVIANGIITEKHHHDEQGNPINP